MYNYSNYEESAKFIKGKIGEISPKIAIVLGSGLGILSEDIENKITIKYEEIPNFPVSTVEGHAGELLIGTINDVPVIAMNGRFHYYEGYTLEQVTFPIRVFKLLGIEKLILTNAAGGINTNYKPGELIVISDFLSFFSDSTLRGKNIEEFGTRFPDMSEAFNKELSAKLKETIAKHMGVANEGVYAYMKGPNYESPAEIRALRTLGADTVGMSTVPEVIVANHAGIKTVGVSCVTNMAAGVSNEKLSHEEVQKTADMVKFKFKEVIKEYITII